MPASQNHATSPAAVSRQIRFGHIGLHCKQVFAHFCAGQIASKAALIGPKASNRGTDMF